jgi:hypothetical protein
VSGPPVAGKPGGDHFVAGAVVGGVAGLSPGLAGAPRSDFGTSGGFGFAASSHPIAIAPRQIVRATANVFRMI